MAETCVTCGDPATQWDYDQLEYFCDRHVQQADFTVPLEDRVNEVCRICGEKRSAHLPPGETHPREARGEGRYELVSYWEGFDFNRGEWRRDENYRFVSVDEIAKRA